MSDQSDWLDSLRAMCDHGIGLNECDLASAVPGLLDEIDRLARLIVDVRTLAFDSYDVARSHGMVVGADIFAVIGDDLDAVEQGGTPDA